MKKRILLFTAVAGIASLTLSSYDDGPAAHSQNRTGAKGSVVHCGGGGCHNSGVNTSTNVEITVDSGAIAGVTSYAPGKVYTVKIHGTNSLLSYSKFGFSFASVKGSGSAQTQAGSAGTFPANVAAHTFNSLSFIEHSAVLTAATAGVYDVSFQWTAPVAGTGSVTMYCTLNAVDGNGSASDLDMSRNTSLVLTEQAVSTTVAAVTNNASITAYPNPTMGDLNIAVEHADNGVYALQVYDLNGRIVANENITINGATQVVSIITANWAAGLYNVVLQKDGFSKVIPVAKTR